MKKIRRTIWLFSMLTLMMVMISGFGVSAASKVKLSATKMTLFRGKTTTLTVSGTDSAVTWKSSKKSVATVSSKGVVTAKKKGTAVISAKVDGKTYKCKITVKQPVTSIKLNQSSIALTKGKTYTLKTTVKPSNANVRTVTWRSNNTSVVKVSSKGKVTAVSAGTAVITALAKDGSGKKATCKVTVKAPSSGSASLTISETSLNLTVGSSSTLKAVTKDGAKVAWGSSNPSVVSVSAGTVTAKKAGTAVIAAMRVDRSKTVYCKVTVKEKTSVSKAGESAAARQLLNTLQNYSNQVKKDKAAGKVWSYSNSSAASTWSASRSKLNSNGIAYSNCALLVRWALRDMGIINSKNFWGTVGGDFTYRGDVKTQLLKHCEIIKVYKTPAQLLKEGNLLPGDICSWVDYQHTNVYAGNNLWYDSGRSGAVGSYNNGRFEFSSFGPASTINMTGTTIGYIIRLK